MARVRQRWRMAYADIERTALGSPTYGIASTYGGRPIWHQYISLHLRSRTVIHPQTRRHRKSQALLLLLHPATTAAGFQSQRNAHISVPPAPCLAHSRR
jgi:hypothetical protein